MPNIFKESPGAILAKENNCITNIIYRILKDCSVYLKRKQERAIMILEEEKAHEQLCQSA